LGNIAAKARALLRANSNLERVGGELDALGCGDGAMDDEGNGVTPDLAFRNGKTENTGLGDDKGFCITV
jgi:hypothetical protein